MVNVSRSSFIHAHIQKTPASSLFYTGQSEAILDKISGQVIAIPPCLQTGKISSVIIPKNINVFIIPNSLQI